MLQVNVGVRLYYLSFFSLSSSATFSPRGETTMNSLVKLGISYNVPKADFLCRLRRLDIHVLKSIRDELFISAKSSDLVNQRDVLVERRNSATRPAVLKLAEDIWKQKGRTKSTVTC